MNETKFWKLDSPKMCRDFLENLCFGGKKIEEFTMGDGSVIKVSEATDEQCVFLAKDVARMIDEARTWRR